MDAFLTPVEKDTTRVVIVNVHCNTKNGSIKLPFDNTSTFDYIRRFSAAWANMNNWTMARVTVNGGDVPLDARIAEYDDLGQVDVIAFERKIMTVCIPERSNIDYPVNATLYETFGCIVRRVSQLFGLDPATVASFTVGGGEQVGYEKTPTVMELGTLEDWVLTFDRHRYQDLILTG